MHFPDATHADECHAQAHAVLRPCLRSACHAKRDPSFGSVAARSWGGWRGPATVDIRWRISARVPAESCADRSSEDPLRVGRLSRD